MEEDEESAGSGVPIVGGTQIESSAVQVGAAIQEDDPARPQVPTIERTLTDVGADSTRVEATGQGEHPDKKEE